MRRELLRLVVTLRLVAILRAVVLVAAAVVMIGVFLIPHSVRGSQLNYEKLEKGVSPTRAIETG